MNFKACSRIFALLGFILMTHAPAVHADNVVDDRPQLLSYNELMLLPEQARVEYIHSIRSMLIELSKVPHVFGGRFVVDANERSSKLLSLMMDIAENPSFADAIGDQMDSLYKDQPKSQCPANETPEQWGKVTLCELSGTLDGDCEKQPGYVSVQYNGFHLWGGSLPTRCMTVKEFKKFTSDPDLLKQYHPQLSKDSEAKMLENGIPKPDVAKTIAAAKVIDQKATKNHEKLQCADKLAAGSKEWKAAAATYRGKKEANQCIYAGFFVNYFKPNPSDVKNSTCQAGKKVEFGNVKVTCKSKGQIVCNPLLFGLASVISSSDKGASAYGQCVPRGSAATQKCDELATEAEKTADADVKAGKKPADSKTITAANLLNEKFPGIKEAWNTLKDSFSKNCNNPEFQSIHCTECGIMEKRLTEARYAAKPKAGGDEPPSVPAPNSQGPAERATD